MFILQTSCNVSCVSSDGTTWSFKLSHNATLHWRQNPEKKKMKNVNTSSNISIPKLYVHNRELNNLKIKCMKKIYNLISVYCFTKVLNGLNKIHPPPDKSIF